MSIHARIYASFEDRSFDPSKNLAFCKDGNWWCPEPVTGPVLAQELYGKQLALDFMDWALGSCESTKRLVDIVNAMPAEKGGVERGFLEFIAQAAPMGAMA